MELLSRVAAAEFLRVSTRTLDRMAHRGELNPVRFNARCLFFKQEDLRRWREQHRLTASAA